MSSWNVCLLEPSCLKSYGNFLFYNAVYICKQLTSFIQSPSIHHTSLTTQRFLCLYQLAKQSSVVFLLGRGVRVVALLERTVLLEHVEGLEFLDDVLAPGKQHGQLLRVLDVTVLEERRLQPTPEVVVALRVVTPKVQEIFVQLDDLASHGCHGDSDVAPMPLTPARATRDAAWKARHASKNMRQKVAPASLVGTTGDLEDSPAEPTSPGGGGGRLRDHEG